MANSVIVYDDEYQSAAARITSYGNVLINRIERYCSSLELITAQAIRDPRIAPRLQTLGERVAALTEPLEEAASRVAGLCGEYVQAVDEADQFLA